MTATSAAGKIVVSWPTVQKPNLAGYVVERAFLFDGPYEALSAQSLPPGTSQYEDDAVRGGTTYYYRVRAVNSRGDLGTPSDAAVAQSDNDRRAFWALWSGAWWPRVARQRRGRS